MVTITLKGHKGIGKTAEGEAQVCQDAISYMSDTGKIFETPMEATVTNKISLPELYGQSLANKVLVFSSGKGGIFSSALIMGLVKNGLGPTAMINVKTHPVFALAAILTGIPTVDCLDKNPLEVIKTGDWVKVDAEKGIVEVTQR